jgi:hypothetical protein
MSKVETYRQQLRTLADWEPFLLSESSLPGPRSNLELAQAAADEGNEALFRHFVAYGPERTPPGTALEFLPLCGAIGLGRLVAEGRSDLLPLLRSLAVDPRWRVREGVAMALQRVGDRDMEALLGAVEPWSTGSPLEQRAVAAGLCEPRLLSRPAHVRRVLQILDAITASLLTRTDRHSDEFRTLRQGLAYCWSVAVAALPEEGKALMEKWLACDDKDVRWVMRENLKKERLARLDRAWAGQWLEK